MSPRALLHAFFKHKWLILLTFLVCSAGSTLAVLHFSKPYYEAVAQLLLSPGDVQLPTDGRVPTPVIGNEERIGRAIELLAGRSLAERVVDAVGYDRLYADLAGHEVDKDAARMVAVARLMKYLTVTPGQRSSIISLRFRHEDRELAARVPNLVGQLYVDRYLGVEKDSKADAFFEDQLHTLRQKLNESEQALESFRSRNRIAVDLPEERRLASAELASLRASVDETRTRQGELNGQIETIGSKMTHDARIPRSYYKLKERLASLEAEENELAAAFTPAHPRLRDVREQLRSLREKLRADGVDSSYGSATEQEGFNTSLQIELSRVRGELQAARVREAGLASRVEHARKRLESLETVDSEFNRLQTQVRTDAEAYRLFLSKVQDARIANVRDAEKVVGIRVIEEARPPTLPVDSRRNLKLAGGILASAGAALGLALLLELLRRRVETADDVEAVLGLPMLGSIPELEPR
ncbi:MAG: hypothetical protein ROZ64_18000 [Burkholderiaceae bacterium]|jgi:uncharacterized protein involved in exopolysaccharide biosynthesis|nr:hypothetical protein [Burkholderiaceae bacterium]